MTRRRERAWPVLAVLALGGAHACSNYEDPVGPGSVYAIEIEDVLGPLSLTVGESRTLAVAALDRNGNDLDDVEIGATSTNEQVATVRTGAAANGVVLAHTDFTVTGVGAGTATITFTAEGSDVSRTLSVSVSGPGT